MINNIPNGIQEDVSPYILPTNIKRVLGLFDVHYPFHYKKGLELAIKEGLKQKVDCVLLGGDAVDFYSISRWLKRDINEITFKKELEKTREFFKTLRKIFKGKMIIYIEGNHEERLEKYKLEKCPAFASLEELQIENLLQLKQLNIKYINNNRIIKAGDLNIIHGHELRGGGGASPAKSMRLRAKESILFGHLHKVQEDITTTISGKIYGGWAVGHLGDPHPHYMPYNEWCHGFCIINMLGKGEFKVNNYRILKGKIY